MTRSGYLCMDGWAGRTEQACIVIGETQKRYRIRAVMRTKLAGRSRWLETGQTALVPKHAVKFDASANSYRANYPTQGESQCKK